MESKPNFAKVHGPRWTQIKIVLIQKGLLDNQNPSFCIGWPGLYFLDNIDQLGSVCVFTYVSVSKSKVIVEIHSFCKQFCTRTLFL